MAFGCLSVPGSFRPGCGERLGWKDKTAGETASWLVVRQPDDDWSRQGWPDWMSRNLPWAPSPVMHVVGCHLWPSSLALSLTQWAATQPLSGLHLVQRRCNVSHSNVRPTLRMQRPGNKSRTADGQANTAAPRPAAKTSGLRPLLAACTSYAHVGNRPHPVHSSLAGGVSPCARLLSRARQDWVVLVLPLKTDSRIRPAPTHSPLQLSSSSRTGEISTSCASCIVICLLEMPPSGIVPCALLTHPAPLGSPQPIDGTARHPPAARQPFPLALRGMERVWRTHAFLSPCRPRRGPGSLALTASPPGQCIAVRGAAAQQPPCVLRPETRR